MSTRRLFTFLALGTLLAGAIAPSVSAAKPADPKAPTFGVALPKSVLSGDNRRADLAFQFTSTTAKGAPGLLRLGIPVQMLAKNGQTIPVGWTVLQNTKPAEEGYFRVDNETCTSASLAAFHPDGGFENPQTIDVAFQCDRGQHFTIAYFPRSEFLDTKNDFSPDEWDFLVQTRSKSKEPWVDQPAKHVEVQFSEVTIITPGTILIPPPQTVVVSKMVPTYDPNSGQIVSILVDAPAQITDVHTANISLTLSEPQVLADGRGLVLANPTNFVNDTQVELVITTDPSSNEPIFKEVRLFPPRDAFSYLVTLPGESQYVPSTLPMVYVAVDPNPTSMIVDRQEGVRCAQAGGQFQTPFIANWQCLVAFDLRTQTQADALRSELADYAYCTTKNVTLEFKVIDNTGFWVYTCQF